MYGCCLPIMSLDKDIPGGHFQFIQTLSYTDHRSYVVPDNCSVYAFLLYRYRQSCDVMSFFAKFRSLHY